MVSDTCSSQNFLPFGIPTTIIAEDPLLLAAAVAAYAHWATDAPFAGSALELRLHAGSASPSGVSLGIRVEGSRLWLSGDGIEGSADSTSGKAYATVPGELANNRRVLTEVTDTLLLFMLARRARTPVHGAGFILDARAIVLAGPSGAGKSTLAMAAANRGFPVLSDDMLFIQLQPEFALWGFPRPIHLFAEDSPAGDHPTRTRNDKVKHAVPAPAVALRADKALLVLIERGDSLSLSRIEPTRALDAMMRLEPGFDLLEEQSRGAIAALAAHGSWRLTLERDADRAIELLARELPNP